MAAGFTIFCTYLFESDVPYNMSTTYGYQTAIHCNYIQKLETDNLSGKALNLYFSSADDFMFLAHTGTTNGTGFTATRIYALIQIISEICGEDNPNVTPDPAKWMKYDLTDQILNHVIGQPIKKENLVNTLFKVDLNQTVPYYDLSYLDYPTSLSNDNNKLCFGEEAFFFGNVETDIKATVYTTEIPIVLPLNQYNSTTNPTWDGMSNVYITEIGIYDENNNLVAIGKLNTPISKDSGIARTILFALDF